MEAAFNPFAWVLGLFTGTVFTPKRTLADDEKEWEKLTESQLREQVLLVDEAIGAMEDLMDFSRNSAKPGFDPLKYLMLVGQAARMMDWADADAYELGHRYAHVMWASEAGVVNAALAPKGETLRSAMEREEPGIDCDVADLLNFVKKRNDELENALETRDFTGGEPLATHYVKGKTEFTRSYPAQWVAFRKRQQEQEAEAAAAVSAFSASAGAAAAARGVAESGTMAGNGVAANAASGPAGHALVRDAALGRSAASGAGAGVGAGANVGASVSDAPAAASRPPIAPVYVARQATARQQHGAAGGAGAGAGAGGGAGGASASASASASSSQLGSRRPSSRTSLASRDRGVPAASGAPASNAAGVGFNLSGGVGARTGAGAMPETPQLHDPAVTELARQFNGQAQAGGAGSAGAGAAASVARKPTLKTT